MKRLIGLILCIIFVSSITVPVFAARIIPEENELLTSIEEILGEDIDGISRDALFIPEEVAYYIALQFLNDMIEFDLAPAWDDNTEITYTTMMYNETGEEINAYTFELSSGYIVVAAYLDVPNLIPEWADVARPLYDELDITDDEYVVYLGSLNYLSDNGGDELINLDGISVEREDLYDILEDKSDIEYVPENVMNTLAVATGESLFSEAEGSSSVSPTSAGRDGSGQIKDPFAHAIQYYGPGPWRCYEYANDWEDNFLQGKLVCTADASFNNNCGPTAVANLVKAWGNKRNINAVTSKTNQQLLNEITNLGLNGLYYFPIGGTGHSGAGSYIKNAFALFGKTVEVSNKNFSFDTLKSTLTANGRDRLMYITLGTALKGHAHYGYHAVVGYAYTRLINESTGYYKTYVKVADGWTSSNREGRCIDAATMITDKYWEVKLS